MEHIYGPNTEEVRSEAASISRALKEDLVDKLGARAAKETLVVATADHGQVLSPPDETLILNRYRKLVGNLARSDRGEKILPWGAPGTSISASQRAGSKKRSTTWLEPSEEPPPC